MDAKSGKGPQGGSSFAAAAGAERRHWDPDALNSQ
jgi:hypothetical protein